jgi:hypothetical protein
LPEVYRGFKQKQAVASMADPRIFDRAADAAIARVLAAERDARASVRAAQAQVEAMAEAARADSRALAERTERRVRGVASAFERDTALRLAQIESQVADLQHAPPPDAADRAALRRAVAALARSMIAGPP